MTFFNTSKLSTKLLISFGTLFIVLFGISNGYLYFQATKMVEKNTTEQTVPAQAWRPAFLLRTYLEYLEIYKHKGIIHNAFVEKWLSIAPEKRDELIMAKHLDMLSSQIKNMESGGETSNFYGIFIPKSQKRYESFLKESNDSMDLPIIQWLISLSYSQEEKSHWKIFETKEDGKTHIVTATPIIAENGDITAIAYVKGDITGLPEYLAQVINVGEKGYNFIANLNGEIIISSSPEFESYGNIHGINVMSDAFDDMMSSEKKQTLYELDGEKRFMVSGKLKPSPWIMVTDASITESLAPLDKEFKISLLIELILIAIGLILIFIMIKRFSNEIKVLKDFTTELGQGNIDAKLQSESKIKEIKELGSSFVTLRNKLSEAINFAHEISNGILDAKYPQLGENDALGKSIRQIQQSLSKYNEKEQKNRWITEGLAEFAVILRNGGNVAEVCDNILRKLIKKIEANQAIIFIAEERGGETLLTEKATYAYSRKKFHTETITLKPGEGLIGQIYLEKRTAIYNEIPEEYVKITSGLGESTARNVYIIPLIFNDHVYGVLEIATFDPIEEHKLDFIDKLSEAIASTISMIQTNDQTRRMLDETKVQSEELRSQEEELRQNLEELSATQEENDRQKRAYEEEIALLKKEIKELKMPV
ncbi:GAF domain-containing protein [Aureibacter tunicatorum]|uniref:HAMP domain-containing protein n=1 Tax=Aureibacter tunicatorum TaxID=866807 RepID=A0AAE3XRJ7_9BACT|nr:GAF domain-containing protein [Aureibacter tunicatorum]MDR6240719.1 HAMP domain-containing protein [Aureibacter tunicatorum]BDD06948.1 hypothetical protein AUTU_44310 [Aureibacter tunicatorum]